MLKNKTFQKVIRISTFIFSIIFILLVTFYVWGALNIPRIERELSYQNSSNYDFYQNPITRHIIIKRDEVNIYSFFFKPQVFAVWIDETRSFVFLITSDTGVLRGAHGLYIYNGKETKKVYQSRTIEFADSEKNAAHLYTPWLNLNSYKNDFDTKLNLKKESMDNGVFNISPDGRYLFSYESGYEGGAGFVIDLPSLTKIDLGFDGSNNLFWSPNKECAISYVYGYGYHGLQLVYYEGDDLKVKNYDKNFMPDEFTGVYWMNNCASVVSVKSDSVTNYYKLDKDSENPVKVNNPNISKFKKGEIFRWPLKNIYFTVKDPSKK